MSVENIDQAVDYLCTPEIDLLEADLIQTIQQTIQTTPSPEIRCYNGMNISLVETIESIWSDSKEDSKLTHDKKTHWNIFKVPYKLGMELGTHFTLSSKEIQELSNRIAAKVQEHFKDMRKDYALDSLSLSLRFETKGLASEDPTLASDFFRVHSFQVHSKNWVTQTYHIN